MHPGASLAEAPVNLCLKENCEAGCTNKLVVTKSPHVINTNATSLVGVDSYIGGYDDDGHDDRHDDGMTIGMTMGMTMGIMGMMTMSFGYFSFLVNWKMVLLWLSV